MARFIMCRNERGCAARFSGCLNSAPCCPERKSSWNQLEQLKGPVFKSAEDPRITSVGKFLRRYSLDELPQLCNVLKGQMILARIFHEG